MHFNLSKYRGLSISSFDMEEMTGRDSMDAAARAIGPRSSEGAGPNAFQINIQHRNQLIAQSISKVDDENVVRPHIKWEDWTLRTQDFVVKAYMRLNEATDTEVDDFIKAHFGTPVAVSAPDSSGSGSGSQDIYEGPVYPSKDGSTSRTSTAR